MNNQADTERSGVESTLDQVKQKVDDASERQKLAKEVLNIPDEFSLNGHKFFIQHLTFDAVTAMNQASIEYQRCLASIRDSDEIEDWKEKSEKLKLISQELQRWGIEILFYIINPDPFIDEPKYTREWIGKTIPITGSVSEDDTPSLGIQIIRAYKARIRDTDFFSEIWQMGVF